MARKPRKSVKVDCRVTIAVREWEGRGWWVRFPPPIPEHERRQAIVIKGPRSAIGKSALGPTDVAAVQALLKDLQGKGFSGVATVERQQWPWPPLYPAES